MFTVYVLFSGKFNKIYIGMTSNPEQRFKSHNELSKKGWTKNFRPWTIIYQEKYVQKEAIEKRKTIKICYRQRFHSGINQKIVNPI
ncbi:MAG TPA: GIY-YIG nuclease family protein [Hanamia sp.]|nr:GIY-YIG nuclease family protein [Hanamia sp.]